jgi:arylformamidase
MKIIDISPLISETIAVWPGDQPFRRTITQSISGGSNIDLSSFSTTVHLGAHTDAPSHFVGGAETIDNVNLDAYCGPCQVIEVNLPRGSRIRPVDLQDKIRSTRVLFKTNSYPEPNIFNEDFCALSPELIDYLHTQNCVLVGIDTPSIDLFSDKVLECHQALKRTGIRNVEGLVLTPVNPGLYTLIALPLRLAGADASPVRAVLIK